MDWRAIVYQPRKRNKEEEYEWELLRNHLVRESKYICKACRKRKPAKLLTAHHIKPRSEGGTDTTDNLVVLCVECHDKIEADIENFRTFSDISHAFARREKVRKSKPTKIEYSDKWQSWVYGGKRPPERGNN